MSISKICRLLCVALTGVVWSLPADAQQRHRGPGIEELVDQVNAELLADGANFRIGMMEYLSADLGERMGRTVIFSDRGNKQLIFHFVANDPRRRGDRDITWIIDEFDAPVSGYSQGQASTAIISAMGTWQGSSCSALPLVDLGTTVKDEGFVQFFISAATGIPFGGNPDITDNPADIVHAGFLPQLFFEIIGGPEPGGGTSILGVTFTIIFTDDNGNPTDIDGDGKGDTAYREIYYNDFFNWVDNPNDAPGDGLVDFESVALHEVGHGLSQGHFGDAFISGTNPNGQGQQMIQIAPEAVMNAGYIFASQDLLGTDIGGHCSIWGHWPN